MATLNPATWHRLRHLGAIAPGYQADLLLLADLESFVPETVLKRGRPVGEIERVDVPEWVKHTVRIRHVAARDFTIPWEGGAGARDRRDPRPDRDRVARRGAAVEDGHAVADPERTWRRSPSSSATSAPAGWRSGSCAGSACAPARSPRPSRTTRTTSSSSAIDDQDMARAIARLTEIGGGVVVVEDRGVRAELALPIARPDLGGAARRGRRGEPRLHRRGGEARLHAALAVPDDGVPRALGDPEPEDHRPRASSTSTASSWCRCRREAALRQRATSS